VIQIAIQNFRYVSKVNKSGILINAPLTVK